MHVSRQERKNSVEEDKSKVILNCARTFEGMIAFSIYLKKLWINKLILFLLYLRYSSMNKIFSQQQHSQKMDQKNVFLYFCKLHAFSLFFLSFISNKLSKFHRFSWASACLRVNFAAKKKNTFTSKARCSDYQIFWVFDFYNFILCGFDLPLCLQDHVFMNKKNCIRKT